MALRRVTAPCDSMRSMAAPGGEVEGAAAGGLREVAPRLTMPVLMPARSCPRKRRAEGSKVKAAVSGRMRDPAVHPNVSR